MVSVAQPIQNASELRLNLAASRDHYKYHNLQAACARHRQFKCDPGCMVGDFPSKEVARGPRAPPVLMTCSVDRPSLRLV